MSGIRFMTVKGFSPEGADEGRVRRKAGWLNYNDFDVTTQRIIEVEPNSEGTFVWIRVRTKPKTP